MGRKRQRRMLDVYVGTSKVGMYSREPSGATSFRYDPGWLASDKAFSISVSMPLTDRVWSGESAASYFDGLLPDDRTVREKIAAREQADSAGIFDLLAVLGRDCVGALRFVPEGLDPGDPTNMEYRPSAMMKLLLGSLPSKSRPSASISMKMTFVSLLQVCRKKRPFSGSTIMAVTTWPDTHLPYLQARHEKRPDRY